MSRMRTLKPGFFANEELAELAPLTRLLFAGLWTEADREGRLEDRPRRLKAALLPYDDCDVAAMLDALERSGFIQRYEAEGDRYIAIVSFGKHQRPSAREAQSTLPAAPEHSLGHAEAQPRQPSRARGGNGVLGLGSGVGVSIETPLARERAKTPAENHGAGVIVAAYVDAATDRGYAPTSSDKARVGKDARSLLAEKPEELLIEAAGRCAEANRPDVLGRKALDIERERSGHVVGRPVREHPIDAGIRQTLGRSHHDP